MDDLEEQMRNAAALAAHTAAGKVVGDHIARAHPGLPPLRWGAGDGFGDVTWNVCGIASGGDDAETHRIVVAYAVALDGKKPQPVAEGGGTSARLQTVAEVEGVTVRIWGAVTNGATERELTTAGRT